MLCSTASAAALQLARGISTSSAASAAAPALLSSLGFGGARVDTPLNEPLPTAVKPLGTTVPTAPPKLEAGALASGTKVVAVDSAGAVSSVSLVFPAGSAYETEATLGSSRVLEELAFKASANRTTFRITRELEKVGAVATATAGREFFSYNVSAVKLNTPEVLEVLLDSALNAKLNFWEVQEAIASAKANLAHTLKDPQAVVTDALHRAAFDGGLGQPLHPDPSALDHVTKESLQAYLASTLRPANSVLAAAGVGLEEFKELAGPLVSASSAANAAGPAASAAASSYVGGSLSVLSAGASVHVGLAFEAKGGLSDAKGAAAAAVARALLDGPTSVLPHASRDEELLAGAVGLSSLYKSTGLLGLIAPSTPAQVGAVVDAASKKFEALAKGVSDTTLRAAKQLVVGSYKAGVSSASGLAATAAPQLLLTGKFSPAEFVAAVEALSAADVAGLVTKGLKGSPAFVTLGSLGVKAPRYEALAKRFA